MIYGVNHLAHRSRGVAKRDRSKKEYDNEIVLKQNYVVVFWSFRTPSGKRNRVRLSAFTNKTRPSPPAATTSSQTHRQAGFSSFTQRICGRRYMSQLGSYRSLSRSRSRQTRVMLGGNARDRDLRRLFQDSPRNGIARRIRSLPLSLLRPQAPQGEFATKDQLEHAFSVAEDKVTQCLC